MPSDPWSTEKYQTCLTDMGTLLSRLVPLVQKFERRLLRSLGFTASQGTLLLAIKNSPDLTMGEAAQALGVEISTLTRIADLLIRDEMIVKTPQKEDKRRVILTLTSPGLEKSIILREAIDTYYRRLIEGLPPGHVREIMDSIQVLASAMEAALE